MPIDIAVLATTVVSSFLIPYLKKGAEKFADAVTDKLGEGAADQTTGIAQKLWSKVKSAFVSEDDKAVLKQFEQRPEAAKTLVEEILRDKLRQDSTLAQELNELIKSAPTKISTGAHVEHANDVSIVDAREANFSHASGVEITGKKVGEFPPKTPGPPKEKKPEGDS